MSLITSRIYLGSANDAQNSEFLKSKNIQLIVNCAKEVPNFYPNNYQYLNLELDDSPSQSLSKILQPTADKIIQYIKSGKKVFIHCAAGISRSSTITIFVIMKLHNWSFDEAFKYVKNMHPQTNPNKGFIEQLQKISNKDSSNPSNPSNIEFFERPDQQIQSNDTRSKSFDSFGTDSQQRYSNGSNLRQNQNQTNMNISENTQDINEDKTSPSLSSPLQFISNRRGLYGSLGESSPQIYNKKWNSLALDASNDDLPIYAQMGKSRYARIF